MLALGISTPGQKFVGRLEAQRIRASLRQRLFGDATASVRIAGLTIEEKLSTRGPATRYRATHAEHGPVGLWTCPAAPEPEPEVDPRPGVTAMGRDGDTLYVATPLRSGPSMLDASRPLSRWSELADALIREPSGAFHPADVAIDNELTLDPGWAQLVELHGGTELLDCEDMQPYRPPSGDPDAYGFCVALWRGLTGELPFAADGERTLAEAKTAVVPRPPASANLERRLVELLRDGLRGTLSLPEIRNRLGRRRRWPLLAGAGVAVAGALIFAAASMPTEDLAPTTAALRYPAVACQLLHAAQLLADARGSQARPVAASALRRAQQLGDATMETRALLLLANVESDHPERAAAWLERARERAPAQLRAEVDQTAAALER